VLSPAGLLLIRHGETPLNVARVLQPADTPLSPNGLAQAGLVARRLAGLGLAGIVSSDLPRARQTAAAISDATGLPVRCSALLQERNFGDLRGLPYDTLAEDPIASDAAPPGGESGAVFRARVDSAFAWVVACQREFGGLLAVVSHGLVIHAMLARHARLPDGTVLPARIANTSLSRLVAEPPHAALLIDCCAHLDAAAADDRLALSGG